MKFSHPLVLSAAAALVAITAVSAPAFASFGHGDRMGPHGMMAAQDSDKDGFLSLDEFLAPKETRFAQLDANKDGAVSAEEYAAAPAANDAMAKRMGEWEAKASEAQKALMSARKTQHFRALDADGNGAISKDEYLATAKLKFAALDENNDGKVDARGPGKGKGMGCEKGEHHRGGSDDRPDGAPSND
jgi:Ca2+-binding EF-hand superfamily protein